MITTTIASTTTLIYSAKFFGESDYYRIAAMANTTSSKVA